MSSKKVIYTIIAAGFLVFVLISQGTSSEKSILCSEILETEILSKTVSKPYMREIDVLKVDLANELIFIQSNDEGFVREIQRELNSCKEIYELMFYKKEKRNNEDYYFVKKAFL